MLCINVHEQAQRLFEKTAPPNLAQAHGDSEPRRQAKCEMHTRLNKAHAIPRAILEEDDHAR
jgi:hypothetical protein